MNIRHLRIFIAVYQCASITKAAEELFLSQPNVTRTIQEIEKYYGVKLFERMNRKLAITEVGKHFYNKAIHIVDAFDSMEQDLKDWDEIGVLRIGATITIGNFLVPDLVSLFQNTHPKLTIQVKVSNGAIIENGLINNELDLALFEGDAIDENLICEKFRKDKLVLVMSPSDSLSHLETIRLKDLQYCKFLLREPGSVGRSYIDSVFESNNIQLTPTWESSSTHAIIQAIIKGLGISILPFKLVEEYLESGEVITKPILGESFERESSIVWHKNKMLSKSALEFIDLCKKIEKNPSLK